MNFLVIFKLSQIDFCMENTFPTNLVKRYAENIKESWYYSKASCDAFVDNSWEAQCLKLQKNLYMWLLISASIFIAGIILVIVGISAFNNPSITDDVVFIILGIGFALLLVGVALFIIMNAQKQKDRMLIGNELLTEYKLPIKKVDIITPKGDLQK